MPDRKTPALPAGFEWIDEGHESARIEGKIVKIGGHVGFTKLNPKKADERLFFGLVRAIHDGGALDLGFRNNACIMELVKYDAKRIRERSWFHLPTS